jgi:hypothetical protein
MAPESKLLFTIDVGAYTLAMAQAVMHQVALLVTPGCVPLFLTDGHKAYCTLFSPILATGSSRASLELIGIQLDN